MFKKKEEEHLYKSMENMKHWLAIVEQGRLVYDDPNKIDNEFSHKGALYKALDLNEIDDYEFELNM